MTHRGAVFSFPSRPSLSYRTGPPKSTLTAGQFDEPPPAYVERAFRRYLECGILADRFARTHYDACEHDFLIAFSCKMRGVCPSCNTLRMVETAAHLVEHVFPNFSVRWWVLSTPLLPLFRFAGQLLKNLLPYYLYGRPKAPFQIGEYG